MQHDLDAGRGLAADAPAIEPRRDHPGVVEDECIARPQQGDEITHAAILEWVGRVRPHHEHPRRIARADGPQRDPVFRQVEIEEPDIHGVALTLLSK